MEIIKEFLNIKNNLFSNIKNLKKFLYLKFEKIFKNNYLSLLFVFSTILKVVSFGISKIQSFIEFDKIYVGFLLILLFTILFFPNSKFLIYLNQKKLIYLNIFSFLFFLYSGFLLRNEDGVGDLSRFINLNYEFILIVILLLFLPYTNKIILSITSSILIYFYLLQFFDFTDVFYIQIWDDSDFMNEASAILLGKKMYTEFFPLSGMFLTYFFKMFYSYINVDNYFLIFIFRFFINIVSKIIVIIFSYNFAKLNFKNNLNFHTIFISLFLINYTDDLRVFTKVFPVLIIFILLSRKIKKSSVFIDFMLAFFCAWFFYELPIFGIFTLIYIFFIVKENRISIFLIINMLILSIHFNVFNILNTLIFINSSKLQNLNLPFYGELDFLFLLFSVTFLLRDKFNIPNRYLLFSSIVYLIYYSGVSDYSHIKPSAVFVSMFIYLYFFNNIKIKNNIAVIFLLILIFNPTYNFVIDKSINTIKINSLQEDINFGHLYLHEFKELKVILEDLEIANNLTLSDYSHIGEFLYGLNSGNSYNLTIQQVMSQKSIESMCINFYKQNTEYISIHNYQLNYLNISDSENVLCNFELFKHFQSENWTIFKVNKKLIP